jgi:hypothetical protein
MLSLTRKYDLFLVMAHQTWSQASGRLRGALQHVGVETTFRLGREDAQRSAPMLGQVDPLSIKHEVVDSGALRPDWGADAHAIVTTVLDTARKRGADLLTTLQAALGQPAAIPPGLPILSPGR